MIPSHPHTLSVHPRELLAPAGSLATLHTAFAFGADTVYAGHPRYSGGLFRYARF